MSETEHISESPDVELIRSVWEEARDLIKKLEGTTVQRLCVEAGATKIEIERGQPMVAASPGLTIAAPTAAPAPAAEDGAPPAEPDNRHAIVAPLVGTFYRSSQPGAKPFVEEGDVVDEGQTVAIVEAMKLMNHVSADQAGKVDEIVVSDGDWVEFEQALIYLVPLED
jgi:acetyl-CoA carboxylase biotin carboxyl carrier protein